MAKAAAERAAKRGKGRPSVYQPKVHPEQARKLALLGCTDPEIANVLGVSLATIKNWKTAHPEFLAAVTRGKTAADADVAASLYERAMGYKHPEIVISAWQGTIIKTKVTRHYPPDTQAAFRWLTNRQPSRWRNQPDPAGGDDAPPPVKVVVEVQDARKRPDDAEAE